MKPLSSGIQEEIAQMSGHLGWWTSDTQSGLEDAHKYFVLCGCTKEQALFGIEEVIKIIKGEYGA